MPTDIIIDLGVREAQVNILEGSIKNGEMVVDSAEVSTDKGSITLDLDGVHEDNITDAISFEAVDNLIEREETLDTSDTDWDEPRIINPDTDLAEVFAGVCYHGPCTSKTLEVELPDVNHPGSRFQELKEYGLIAVVGYKNQRQIVVPTHVAWKEALTIWGDDIDTERTDGTPEDSVSTFDGP